MNRQKSKCLVYTCINLHLVRTKSCLNYPEEYLSSLCIFSCAVQIQAYRNCFYGFNRLTELGEFPWEWQEADLFLMGRPPPTTFPVPVHRNRAKEITRGFLVVAKHVSNSSPSSERAELCLLKSSRVIQHETTNQHGGKKSQIIKIW